MSLLCSAWSWFFDVSNPKDPKLRGWLHPAFAVAFNFGLASAVAFAAFLSSPLPYQEEWLRQQPDSVVQFLQTVQNLPRLANCALFNAAPALQWFQDIVRRALLPEEGLFDKAQAFALYSWEGATLSPQSLAAFLLMYVALMLVSRLYEKGPVMLYDMAWACNLAMLLTAVAIHLNIPFLVSACSCWVAVDQLLWYVDSLSLLVRGRFLVGVAKYITYKKTVCLNFTANSSVFLFHSANGPWTRKLFSTHHLWFIPFTTFVNLRHAAGHSPCCLSVSVVLSLFCVLGSRCCTPYAVHHPNASLQFSGKAEGAQKEKSTKTQAQEAAKDKGEAGSTDVLNVNVAWRCWADVGHHIPILGICDDKPWFLFVLWNQLIWGFGNCLLFGIFLSVTNHLRTDY